MADGPPSHHGDARSGADRRTSAATTPRWVKAFAWVALVVVVAFAALHATGHSLGGHHHHGMPAQGGLP
jgi:hypothetical protein